MAHAAAAGCPLDAARPGDRLAPARSVADAVLLEGYLLYPYRRSSPKNRVRWQFGVLAPRSWIDAHRIPDPGVAGSAESWFQQVECLAEAPADATVRVQVRFLQVQRRQVYATGPDGSRRPVDALGTAVTFDEAIPREVDARFTVADLLAGEQVVPVDVPAVLEHEDLELGARADGRLERTARPLRARLTAVAGDAGAPFRLHRLRFRVENTGTLVDPQAVGRADALRDSLVAAHLLIGLDRGCFLSLLDPPAWAAGAAAACVNQHVFPVLAGADDGADVLLCAPIILYDHPSIAPESPGDLHDAAEIDEILSLRTLTLTDTEKAEARATDPRAAAIVDRVDAMPPELLTKLHGAVRDLRPLGDEPPWWDPRTDAEVDPQTDSVLVAGRRVARGATVRLHPRGRGTDAHDMFLTGRTGTVQAVLRDVDGSVRVAVTVDDDPAADLHEWYGRFFHFEPEEITPL